MSATSHIIHPFPPLFDENSDTLILGSFPSVKSREAMFFYGHPQNRFWKLIPLLYTITGFSDSSVKDVVPNDFSPILQNSRVSRVFCNGALSYNLYMKYSFPTTGIAAQKLPSTSPANAAFSLSRLAEAWKVITEKAP